MKYILLTICLFSGVIRAQDPLRFEKEVNDLMARTGSEKNKKSILFTGSSSIRLWTTLSADFKAFDVINTGFGGSEMTDLLFYADKLIIPFKPTKIFIYEGDNDIAAGRNPDSILQAAGQLLKLLRKALPPKTRIYFISAKPSIARWHLKDQYLLFNQRLKAWCGEHKRVYFIDVWNAMVETNGEVRKDLFVEDNLHMNQKGYAIWRAVIGPYVTK